MNSLKIQNIEKLIKAKSDELIKLSYTSFDIDEFNDLYESIQALKTLLDSCNNLTYERSYK